MLELMHDDPEAAAELDPELKDRANGVFLWMKPVVTSLLTSLRQGGDTAELKIRLRELPPDLSKLYASIIGKMDPSYSKQAATLFRLIHTASILLAGQDIPTQHLAAACHDFKLVLNGKPVSIETATRVRWRIPLTRQLKRVCLCFSLALRMIYCMQLTVHIPIFKMDDVYSKSYFRSLLAFRHNSS